VYWQVSSSATLGTNTAFAGTILASASITAQTGATVIGRLLAGSGAVTLDDNTITVPLCTLPTSSASSSSAPSTPTSAGAGSGTAGSSNGAGLTSAAATPPDVGAAGATAPTIAIGATGATGAAGPQTVFNALAGANAASPVNTAATTTLAATGADSRFLSFSAALAILLGTVFMIAGRRRNTATHRR
jgi:hypothetical protein